MQCCDYVKKVHSVILKHIDGRNLETVLTEVGLHLYAMLLEHFKRFTINTNGGLLISKYATLHPARSP